MTRPAPNVFHLHRLREELHPFRLHFFPTLRSTNDHAAAMRRRGDLFAPAIILAARQTAGRGRGTNSWFSAPGSLTVTFVLPITPRLAAHHVPLAAGLAVRNAVALITNNSSIQLKWPNDILYPCSSPNRHGTWRKLAGLLCERLDNIDLVGLGLNVNRPTAPVPADLAARVMFLQQIPPDTQAGPTTPKPRPQPPSQPPLDLSTILLTIARLLHQTLVHTPDAPFGAILRHYDQHHALLGHIVTVQPSHEPAITGRCEGLDHTGRLLLRVGKKLVPIIAGHVEFR